MTAPRITITLVPPVVGAEIETFNDEAEQYVNAQAQLGPQINAVSEFVHDKAIEVNSAATTATTKATEAATSATTATTAATTATTKATEAATSATAAAGAATTAGTKAGEAATSAASASTAAAWATTQADGAATSASTASAAATAAMTKAGEVVTSATIAGTAATTATTKAGEASTSADTATTKAGEAATSAATAGTAATTATTKATEASASASAANQAKLDAQAAAQSAAGGGEPTIIAGTTAQYWRGDKTWRDFFADVRASTLTGLSTATNAVVAAADTVLVAIGKLQAQITAHFGQGGTAHANASTSVAGFMSGADKTKLDGVATSAAAVGSAAGSALGTAAAGSAATSARSDHVHPLPTAADVGASPTGHGHSAATTGAAGFMAAADKSKLDGIATGATANATDSALRDRTSHTGTQAIGTVTGLQTALDDLGRGAYVAVTGGVIDLSQASGKYALSVNGNVTVSFTNAHATFREAILVEVAYTSGVVTWPASIVWKGGTAPTLTAGKKTWITLYRSNAGTQYVPAVSHEV